MPVILNPNVDGRAPGRDSRAVTDVQYNYKYPLGLKLKPGSIQHDKLRDAILERAQRSRDAMSSRFDSWNDIDKTLTAYIPLSTVEQNLKADDPTKPISIVVPLSYATMETLLTYMVAAFLEQPIFRYEGFTGEDILGTMLLEKVVELQTRKSGAGLQLHTMFRDSLAYGFGAVTPIWSKKYGYQRVANNRSLWTTVGKYIGLAAETQREEVVKFEGNELYNIDPYMYLPDPGYAIQDVQRSEYAGWLRRESRMELLSRERYDDGFFNVQYLKHIDGKSVLGLDLSNRDRYDVATGSILSTNTTEPFDIVYMYVDLIPADWGIGNKKYPELWRFAVAGDQVLIACEPLDLDHNLKPIAVCAPEYDGHSVSPVSRLEVVQGLQTIMDFLYNSHIANVRKAINDMFVLDPSRINVNDLLHPGPGKIIRTRKKAWGLGVKDIIEQLKVSDVTARHLVEAPAVTGMLDRIMGTEDAIQGSLSRKKERITATEYQGTKGTALSRLEKTAKIASLQAMDPLAEMYASQTQQFMSEEQYADIAGEYEEELRAEFGDADRVLVGPLDILTRFNVVPSDGGLPASGDPQLWLSMLQTIGSNESLVMHFDIVRIFKHWARMAGAKNISQFISRQTNAEVLPDEEVARQAEAGNIIPMEGL